jgi:superfamily II DNA or RNA helicase
MPAIVARVPTGCGKSWVIAIAAATLIKLNKNVNIFILTGNNFLA